MRKNRFFAKGLAVLLTAVMTAGVTYIAPAAVYADSPEISAVEEAVEEVMGEEPILIEEAMPEVVISETVGELDNDELFDEYVDQLFLLDGESTGLNICLTGTNAKIYDILLGYITQVAEGSLASTQFSIPISDLGLAQTSWTAEELGVDAIVVDNAITAEAQEAAVSHLDYSPNAIIAALLSNCPYELYWYAKTVGTSIEGPGLTASYNGSEWVIELVGELVFSFSVAEGYSAGDYTVDAEAVAAAQTAAANARAIVDRYQGSSDYEKLLAYKNEICNLVSYNYDALAGTVTNGNAWQLIWVFDGDAETTVVCEGYSKAFKYLCDMSEFNSDLVSCITVTGTMDGGTGEGAHMWDIVRMDDGNNYLVDVTNCDQGSIGADDLLFLAVPSSGNYQSGYVFVCNGTNVSFVYDSSTKNSFGDVLVLSTKQYEEPEADKKWGEPSYTWTDDYSKVTAKRVCETDSSLVETETVETVPAQTKAASCEEKGEITYTATFKNEAFSIQTKTAEIPATGHIEASAVRENEVAATCTAEGSYEEVVYCSVCQKELSREKKTIDKGTHVAEVIPAVAATCTETGLTEGSKCSVCGEILVAQEVLPAKGHSLEKVEAKAATLKAKGNIEHYKCTECGKLFADENGEIELTSADVAIAKLISIKKATITNIKSKTYTGKKQTQSPKVVLNGTTLKKGTDYKLTYSNNINAGKATVKITGIGKYGSSVSKTFTISKAANTLKITTSSKSYKYSTVKKAKKTFSIGAKSAKGKVTYTLSSGAKKAGIKVTSKGTVTIPKKCKKGTYKITVSAAGNSNYKKGTKTVTIRIK